MQQEMTRDAVQSVAEPMSRPAVETNKAQPLITPISPEAAVNKVVDVTKQVQMPSPVRNRIKKWGF